MGDNRNYTSLTDQDLNSFGWGSEEAKDFQRWMQQENLYDGAIDGKIGNQSKNAYLKYRNQRSGKVESMSLVSDRYTDNALTNKVKDLYARVASSPVVNTIVGSFRAKDNVPMSSDNEQRILEIVEQRMKAKGVKPGQTFTIGSDDTKTTGDGIVYQHPEVGKYTYDRGEEQGGASTLQKVFSDKSALPNTLGDFTIHGDETGVWISDPLDSNNKDVYKDYKGINPLILARKAYAKYAPHKDDPDDQKRHVTVRFNLKKDE